MKFGMNLLLWASHITSEQFPIIEKLKKAGYDGVEVPVFEGDVKHFKTLGKELANQGLGCTAVTVLGEDTNPISPDPKIRQAAVDRLRWALENTAAAGGTILAGPVHSPLGGFTGQGPTAEEKAWAAETLHKAAEEGQKVGVKIAVEYLNRFESYFLNTGADTRALVDAVNHPYFRTMYDTFHTHIEAKSPTSFVEALGNRIIHVHISENDRGTPGTGQVHWAETFKALRRINYDGWMTIEAFGRALPALAAATRVWRDLFSQPEEVYTQGLRFMKDSWAKAQAG